LKFFDTKNKSFLSFLHDLNINQRGCTIAETGQALSLPSRNIKIGQMSPCLCAEMKFLSSIKFVVLPIARIIDDVIADRIKLA
jgi:hypothetical protein